MSETVSAGVDIQGSVLRFAEVDYEGDRHRLQRIGSCEFDFNLAHELLQAESPSRLGEVTSVLSNALSGSRAGTLGLTVHPSDGVSFFTPIAADLPVRKRKLHLMQHAAIITGARSPRDYHLATKTVRTAQDSEGEALMWVHVLAVRNDVHDRVEAMIDRLPVNQFAWTLSTDAASRVTARIELTGITQEQALRPFTLAIGQYDGHTEFTLSRDRQWYHSHFADRADTTSDRAYYAVGLLNRLDIPLNSVGRLFIYGRGVDADDYAMFDDIFGVQPEPLDPFRAVNPGDATVSNIEPTAFVPCIGAAL